MCNIGLRLEHSARSKIAKSNFASNKQALRLCNKKGNYKLPRGEKQKTKNLQFLFNNIHSEHFAFTISK